MRLTSNWTRGPVYWRTFDSRDTVYVVGHRSGTLPTSASAEIDHPSGLFQLELKENDLAGRPLVVPGRIFANEGEFVLDEAGQLSAPEDLAEVSVDPGFKFEFYGAVTQFLSAGSSDSTIKIVSSLAQTTTTTNTNQTSINSSASNEVGAQVGGEVSASGKYYELAIGVKVNGSVSSKVVNKIERTVAAGLNVTIATTTSYAEEQVITLKASKLTVVSTSWQRRYVTGSVTLGSDRFRYEATVGYLASRQVTEYDGPDALPAELRAEYDRQHGNAAPWQSDWRWCGKCHGLFFSGGQAGAGTCPAGGTHDGAGSGNYTLAHNHEIESGQSDWRWCHKCQGLFHGSGQAAIGACPTGGQHERGVSGNYSLAHNAPAAQGQSKWRWCHKCRGLFFAGDQSAAGRCPADGGMHDAGTSGDYTMMHEPRP